MQVTLPANYRLPNGRPMSDMVGKLFALQRREVIQYVRSGRTVPINLSGWIDYTTDKLLPYYLWYVADGWKTHKSRIDRALADIGNKAMWSFTKDDKEKDDKKKLALLALLALIGTDVIDDVKVMVRKIVTGLLATSARRVNNILGMIREARITGGQLPPQSDIESAVSEIFTSKSRIRTIGEDEAIRAHHYGMIRAMQQSKYKWMKTWITKEDELVCPVCGPLHNVTIPLDQTFVSIPASGEYSGVLTLVNAPLAHPSCRCKLEVFMEVEPAKYSLRRQTIGVS